MTVDGYDEPVTLKAALTISDNGIHVDYTGTSPASGRGINVPHAYTTAYTVFGLGCVVRPHIPNNAGSLEPLTVSAPDGLHPERAQAQRRRVAPRHRPDAAGRDLRLPAPGHSRARAGRGHLVPVEHHRARPVQGGEGGNYGFGMAITTNGGTGARPDKDGLSATAYPSGVRGTPVEIAETQTPLIFWRKELRPDSGGAGRTRGGLGQIIEIESGIDEPFDLLAAFDRIDHPPRGRDGGGDGEAGFVALKSGQTLKGKGFQLIPPGDRLVVMTPGGGGIGEPAERDRAQVANDLADGLISQETAEKVYAYKPPQAAE